MLITGERRGSPRATFEGQAVIFIGDRRVKARGVDISTTGLAIVAERHVLPGAYLRVNFLLPAEQGVVRWFDADGLVVRSESRGGDSMIGIQFTVIEGHVARAIHDYVERRRQGVARAEQAKTFTSRFHAPEGPQGPGPFGPEGPGPSALESPSGLEGPECDALAKTDPSIPAVGSVDARGTGRVPAVGGPSTAPVTGEYGPMDVYEAPPATESPAAARTGTTDELPAASSRARQRGSGISGRPVGEHETTHPSTLRNLYKDAIRQLDDETKRRKK